MKTGLCGVSCIIKPKILIPIDQSDTKLVLCVKARLINLTLNCLIM